jgi:hypothetical protein
MLIWGGFAPDGARYDPTLDAWTAINEEGPCATGYASFAWTGEVMIVWGGSCFGGHESGRALQSDL